MKCHQDILSNLSDDCLYAIFDFLNREDLDVLEQVSKNMANFVTIVRPRVRKSTGSLEIFKNNNGDVHVNLIRRDLKLISYCMIMKKDRNAREDAKFTKQKNMISKVDEKFEFMWRTKLIAQSLPKFVHEQIRYLNERFAYTSIIISNIMIDDECLDHWSNKVKGVSLCKIIIMFPHYLTNAHRTAFFNEVSSLRPCNMKILNDFTTYDEQTIVSLVHNLFENGDLNELRISSYVPSRMFQFPLPESFYAEIAKLVSFRVDAFTIDESRLMYIVMKRLELSVIGTFNLFLANWTERSTLIAAIRNTEFVEIPSKHYLAIKSKHSIWNAIFSNPGNGQRFSINFKIYSRRSF